MITQYHLRPPVVDLIFQVHQRPLHPEFFELLASRRLTKAGCLVDLWLTRTGHVVTWSDGRIFLSEVCGADSSLPDAGRLMCHRLRGQRHDKVTDLARIIYRSSFHIETLTPDQFMIEQRAIASSIGADGLFHAYTEMPRLTISPVSAMQVQAWEGRLSVSTFHTFPDEFAIVKTQSLIEGRA